MKHFRVKPHYSLNPFNGFPEWDYQVQERVMGTWWGISTHDTEADALSVLAGLQQAELKASKTRLEKRRALMRRMSGAQK